ncbi:MAG: YCF48-related protein, partial [Calditrichaceae bacterium]
MPTPTSNQMTGLYFNDDSIGWSVGQYGTILKTTDGGKSWTIREIPWLYDLSDVHFPSALTGYAIGTDGFIIKSTDGGESWEKQDNSYSNNLNRILFKDELTGWAIGEKGMILHTVDGGDHWLLQTSNSLENLFGIDFIGTDSLCVVGDNKTILLADVTDDSWLNVELSTDCSLEDVFFADSMHGWVCGCDNNNKGIILKSVDGGHQWQKISPEGLEYHTWSGTISKAWPGPLQQIYFDENLATGFILSKEDKNGEDGNQLYKTTTSGLNWLGHAEGSGEFPGDGRFCVLPGKRIVTTCSAGGFRYSDDYGDSTKVPDHDQHWWQNLIVGDNGKLLAIQRIHKNGYSYNFYRSDNFGNTFQALLP